MFASFGSSWSRCLFLLHLEQAHFLFGPTTRELFQAEISSPVEIAASYFMLDLSAKKTTTNNPKYTDLSANTSMALDND